MLNGPKISKIPLSKIKNILKEILKKKKLINKFNKLSKNIRLLKNRNKL